MSHRIPTSLALALALGLALAGCGRDSAPNAAGERPGRRPDVLLLTIDTLRADHLSAWGYPRLTSPTLDRMAAEGTRFAFAQAQRPKTGPSFTSMFTSGYCSDHGVRRIGQPAGCSMRFLAEEMKELGYQTHAVVANAALAREFYFDQGFDTYIETWGVEPRKAGLDPTGAEAVTDLAEAVVGKLDRDRPYFLWVHYVDPHEPYTPPEPFRDHFQGDGHSGPPVEVPVARRNSRQSWNGIGRRQVLDGRTDLPFYVARYDAEIRYVDDQIARLLEALRRRGDYDRMLTVMTSDHGESLGEHNYWFDHGMFGFQTCLHVPLVVRLPGLARAAVDSGPVELVDLAPTILEVAGKRLREGTWMRGRSLVPRLRGEAPPARPIAFAEAGYSSREGWIRVATDGRFTLHRLLDRADRRRVAHADREFALFDLAADPGETRNVADLHGADLTRLRDALAAWEQAAPLPLRGDSDDCGDRAMESDTEAQLRALGYL
ncbi:MAG: Arylsulfatase [Acidobacteria bacterium]|nr:Arylsulfatase [Acidobacteriota bacterium]